MKSTLLTRGVIVPAVAGLAITLSACGSDDDSSDSSASSSTTSSASESAASTAPAASDQPFGAGCAAVPADGEVQTDARADPYPAGASGWHTTQVLAG